MNTIIEKFNLESKDKNTALINKAAEILNNGGLVAFPTETVYGLGANALNPIAVKKIYEAKGRPSDNPLIVHISDISELNQLTENISEKAYKLIEAFWPGPLTIILKKSNLIPKETSGGLDTVAIRFPSNTAAQLIIKAAGVPIAAPSANSSGKPSPTHASHVIFDLNGKIDMIIDGGHSVYGLESTIIDLSTDIPCLLRPGAITKSMIENVIGNINIDKAVIEKLGENEKPKAPGMKYKHYSPYADIKIISGNTDNTVLYINKMLTECQNNNIKAGVIASEQTKDKYKDCTVLVIGDRNKPETIAANLFKMLRKCDFLSLDVVYIESFDESEIGMAIMNRLKKAAGYNIINV